MIAIGVTVYFWRTHVTKSCPLRVHERLENMLLDVMHTSSINQFESNQIIYFLNNVHAIVSLSPLFTRKDKDT